MKVVFIDNGHGVNTAGKRSPDGSLLEYKWTRECALALEKELKKLGIVTMIVTPEETDTLIPTRVKRVNTTLAHYAIKDCIVVSLHNNAAGNDGKWMNGTGWEVFVSLNASQNSKNLATCLAEACVSNGIKLRTNSVKVKYKTGNFGIIRDTKCPAVLTENLFMDNKEECAYLLTQEGMDKMVKIHVDGIKKYFGI